MFSFVMSTLAYMAVTSSLKHSKQCKWKAAEVFLFWWPAVQEIKIQPVSGFVVVYICHVSLFRPLLQKLQGGVHLYLMCWRSLIPRRRLCKILTISEMM